MNISDQMAWRHWGATAALAACGFALTLVVFWPGVLTYDALYVYKAIAEGKVGDWQSPVMTALWALIDPIAPGSGSMFLLTAALYWSGFALVGMTIARRSPRFGVIAVLFAFVPPAFMFVGIIWRDVLFAAVWLFAAALVFAAAESRAAVRVPAQMVALALIALGVTLRTNALFAAPILIAYALWPRGFAWKRTALLYLPAVLVLLATIYVVFYGLLGAMRQHPVHSLYVFDLGGITHFTGENQFPVRWSPPEQQRLVADCYDRLWDVYWHGRRCEFVMRRIETEDRLFGTPVLSAAWRRALLAHPLAYLQHRLSFMSSFLGGENFTIWTQDLDDGSKIALANNRGFVALLNVHEALKSTPLFRVWLWLFLCLTVLVMAWQRRETPAGVFALAVSASAILYVLTYLPFGVAPDFRYAYWAVLAALTGGAAVVAESTRPALATRA